MADLLQFDKLQLIFVVILPGFISIKVWGLINPTARVKTADHLVDAICYSFFNFAALFWLIPIANRVQSQFWSTVIFLIILLVFPVIWPIALKKILSSRRFRGKTLSPVPKAWDYFFGRAESCFMLLHLKNGKTIAGLYRGDSFASAYPEKEDLYISEVWSSDPEGHIIEKIPGTKGMLINKASVDYIELFRIDGED